MPVFVGRGRLPQRPDPARSRVLRTSRRWARTATSPPTSSRLPVRPPSATTCRARTSRPSAAATRTSSPSARPSSAAIPLSVVPRPRLRRHEHPVRGARQGRRRERRRLADRSEGRAPRRHLRDQGLQGPHRHPELHPHRGLRRAGHRGLPDHPGRLRRAARCRPLRSGHRPRSLTPALVTERADRSARTSGHRPLVLVYIPSLDGDRQLNATQAGPADRRRDRRLHVDLPRGHHPRRRRRVRPDAAAAASTRLTTGSSSSARASPWAASTP